MVNGKTPVNGSVRIKENEDRECLVVRPEMRRRDWIWSHMTTRFFVY